MAKVIKGTPATQTPEPKSPATQPDLESLIEKIQTLGSHIVGLRSRLDILEDGINERLHVLESSQATTQPVGFQAIVVDQGGKILIVFGSNDANSDGFTSVEEAITQANDFIVKNRLGDLYFPSVLPVYAK